MFDPATMWVHILAAATNGSSQKLLHSGADAEGHTLREELGDAQG